MPFYFSSAGARIVRWGMTALLAITVAPFPAKWLFRTVETGLARQLGENAAPAGLLIYPALLLMFATTYLLTVLVIWLALSKLVPTAPGKETDVAPIPPPISLNDPRPILGWALALGGLFILPGLWFLLRPLLPVSWGWAVIGLTAVQGPFLGWGVSRWLRSPGELRITSWLFLVGAVPMLNFHPILFIVPLLPPSSAIVTLWLLYFFRTRSRASGTEARSA